MGTSTFQGPVRSLNGFQSQGAGNIVNIANGTNTITLTVAKHNGKTIIVDDATVLITLPSIIATADANGTGPGSDPNSTNNLGFSCLFYIATASTDSDIKTDGTDKFTGSLVCIDTDDDTVKAFVPSADNDVITFNGTTKGGIVGTWVRVTATQALEYLVEGVVVSSGILVTPFADA